MEWDVVILMCFHVGEGPVKREVLAVDEDVLQNISVLASIRDARGRDVFNHPKRAITVQENLDGARSLWMGKVDSP